MFAVTGDKGSTSTLASPAIPNIVIPFVNRVPVLGVLLNAYVHRDDPLHTA